MEVQQAPSNTPFRAQLEEVEGYTDVRVCKLQAGRIWYSKAFPGIQAVLPVQGSEMSKGFSLILYKVLFLSHYTTQLITQLHTKS